MPDDKKQKEDMGELAALMYADPEFRPQIDKWTEERFPGVHARVQAKKVQAEGTQAIDQKIKEFDKKVETEHAARARQRAIEKIQADPELRIREDEIAEVEKLMGERYIGSYEDAAILYRRSKQIAAPRASQDYSMEVPGLGGAGGDETSWLKPAFSNLGDKGVLDRVTKRRVDEIRRDFASGRGARWE